MKFGDIRSILQYVPQFQGNTFVVALDGSVVRSAHFSDILLDLYVLHSLQIRVVVVYGASSQIEELARQRGLDLSNSDGTGHTDEATMELSVDAISRLGNSILQSLTTVKIKAASANAIHGHPAGMVGGKDAGLTGAVESVDRDMLQGFLNQGIIPLIQPLGFDSDGGLLRINSDAVARHIAVALQADKVLYLSLENPFSDIEIDSRQLSIEEARSTLESSGEELSAGLYSKIFQATKAVRDGVPRVHLVDCQSDDALLSELFSNEGVGLMVFEDSYQKTRPARKSDLEEIYLLIHRAVEDEQLLPRSRKEIAQKIEDYLVLEIDENLIGCVAVHPTGEKRNAELACLFVKSGHSGQGHGRLLIEAAINRSRELGVKLLFALSTGAIGYLEKNGFVRSGDWDLLPKDRQQKWAENGRNAVLLVKKVGKSQ